MRFSLIIAAWVNRGIADYCLIIHCTLMIDFRYDFRYTPALSIPESTPSLHGQLILTVFPLPPASDLSYLYELTHLGNHGRQ